MLLLEIGYSEQYDTFTGYVCKDSAYFSYEVNRETVELSPIRENFSDHRDFIKEFSKRNPHTRFLTDSITIRELTYGDLERYRRLALATDKGFPLAIKILCLTTLILCAAVGVYFVGLEYSRQNPQQEIGNLLTRGPEAETIHYYYEIHLISGGSVDGFDLKKNDERILITNRKGLDVTIDLSAIQFIEKVALENSLTRSVIYGSKL